MIRRRRASRTAMPAVAGRGRTIAAALAISLAALQAAGAAEPFRQLKGKDIKARFAGMEFTDDVHWADDFSRDGRIASFSMGKKSASRWRVEKDQLCIAREREEERCYQVSVSGNSVQLREPGVEVFLDGVLQKPAARRSPGCRRQGRKSRRPFNSTAITGRGWRDHRLDQQIVDEDDEFDLFCWWAVTGSNRRPSRCKRDAAPAELAPAHSPRLRTVRRLRKPARMPSPSPQ